MGLRDQLHALVEKLTDEQLREAQIALLDVSTPYNNKPLTEADLEALERSERSDGSDGSRTRRSGANTAGHSVGVTRALVWESWAFDAWMAIEARNRPSPSGSCSRSTSTSRRDGATSGS